MNKGIHYTCPKILVPRCYIEFAGATFPILEKGREKGVKLTLLIHFDHRTRKVLGQGPGLNFDLGIKLCGSPLQRISGRCSPALDYTGRDSLLQPLLPMDHTNTLALRGTYFISKCFPVLFFALLWKYKKYMYCSGLRQSGVTT